MTVSGKHGRQQQQGCCGLGGDQSSHGKSIQFYSLQHNQIERNNVSLLAQSNLHLSGGSTGGQGSHGLHKLSFSFLWPPTDLEGYEI